jgi:hypothetical protein
MTILVILSINTTTLSLITAIMDSIMDSIMNSTKVTAIMNSNLSNKQIIESFHEYFDKLKVDIAMDEQYDYDREIVTIFLDMFFEQYSKELANVLNSKAVDSNTSVVSSEDTTEQPKKAEPIVPEFTKISDDKSHHTSSDDEP